MDVHAFHIADTPALHRQRTTAVHKVRGDVALTPFRSTPNGEASPRLKYGWREWTGAGLLGSVPLVAHAVASLTTGRGWGAADRWVSDVLFLGIVVSGSILAVLLRWRERRRSRGLTVDPAVAGAILLNALALLGAAVLYALSAGRLEVSLGQALLVLAVSEASALGLLARKHLQNGAMAIRARSGDCWPLCFGKRPRKFSTLDLNYFDDGEAGWG